MIAEQTLVMKPDDAGPTVGRAPAGPTPVDTDGEDALANGAETAGLSGAALVADALVAKPDAGVAAGVLFA
jgi:hypothetical protein